MHVSEITVSAGRTYSHPYENYSNLRHDISLRATLDDGESPETATKELQVRAEKMAEEQKQQILADLHQLERQALISSSIASTERQIERLQQELAELKKTPEIESAVPEQQKCCMCGHGIERHETDGREHACSVRGCDCDDFTLEPF